MSDTEQQLETQEATERVEAQAQADAATEQERKERIEEEEAAVEAAAAEREQNQAAANAAAETERQERIAAEEASVAAAAAQEASERAASEAAAEAAAATAQEENKAKPKRRTSLSAAAIQGGITNPKDLTGALKRLTDRKLGINYVMVEVQGKRGTKLVVVDEGKGGFNEMVDKIDEKKVYFIGIKVIGVDERSVSSTRTKYVVATYIGPGAPMLRRGGASTIKAKLTQVWGGIALYYSVADKAGFTHEDLKDRLLQCGGAHKPSFYDFGDGVKLNLGFYDEHKGGGR